MDVKRIQQEIDGACSAAKMLAVARSYLDGDVLRDTVAAEAWLMRAIMREEPLDSVKAMAVWAREILGATEPLSDADYLDIRRQAQSAAGREREELEALLALASSRQSGLKKTED